MLAIGDLRAAIELFLVAVFFYSSAQPGDATDVSAFLERRQRQIEAMRKWLRSEDPTPDNATMKKSIGCQHLFSMLIGQTPLKFFLDTLTRDLNSYVLANGVAYSQYQLSNRVPHGGFPPEYSNTSLDRHCRWSPVRF